MKAICHLRTFCVLAIFLAITAGRASAQGLTTLHSFSGPDGESPTVGLIAATDGNFYGTTYGGGSGQNPGGTVFRITSTGTLTTLHTFCQQPPYCSDGNVPWQIIQGRDGNFYGVTSHGGTINYTDSGFAYQLTAGGSYTVLAQFCSLLHGCGFGAPVGSNPGSIMQASDGNFYGATFNGGNSGVGAVWQLTANNWTLHMLLSFDSGTMGMHPGVTVVQGGDGQLYGVTPNGGSGLPNCASYCGTVFKVSLSGQETVLHSFCSQANCADGATPASPLVRGSDGNFYGSTYGGGANGAGVIFKITPSGAFTLLHNMGGADGAAVLGPMIQGADGNLYGTASVGGAHNYGTIFQITPSGAFTALYSFNNTDGANPQGRMAQDSQGIFYGTTVHGGTNGNGTVFKFQVAHYDLTVSPTGQGTVTSGDNFINCPGTCSHSYVQNSLVTLSANPAQGWQFSSWGGACSGSSPACTVAMSNNETVDATFIQSSYTLTTSISGLGTITSTDGELNCPSHNCSYSYLSFTPVTLNATAAQGWTFAGWSGACSGIGTCNLTMLDNYGVSAYFIQPGSGLEFSAVTPCRLVDTRNNNNPIQGGTSQNFIIPQLGNCGIPTAASAYSLNVTVVPHGSLGYVTVWPAGLAQPGISTMNSRDGRTKAEAVIVQSGAGHAISIYASNTTDVILDINGFFGAAGSGTYQFYPLAPCRVIDTRDPSGEFGGPPLVGGQPRNFPMLNSPCMPQGLSIKAYSLNFAVVPYPYGQPLRYLTVWPEGQAQPQVSTLNNRTATTLANAAIVPAGTGGGISVYASESSQVVVDIDGYFAAPASGGLSLYPTAPCRVIDTRENHGQPFQGEKTIDVVHSVCDPPSNAQAYVLNATVVPPGPMHYLTLWPDPGQQPLVSTLNAIDGMVASNMAIVPNSDGSADTFASDLTQLILDISSYFAP